MSKALGNIYTVPEIEAMGYELLALRYELLSGPYRTRFKFTTQSLAHPQNTLSRHESFLLRVDEVSRSAAHDAKHSDGAADQLIGKFLTDFETAMDDDLNTASALGALFTFIREGNIALDDGRILAGDAEGLKTALMKIDPVLDVFPKQTGGFVTLEAHAVASSSVTADLTTSIHLEAHAISSAIATADLTVDPAEENIERLIGARNAARKARNFAESDRIRDELLKRGIILEDTPGGTRWRRG